LNSEIEDLKLKAENYEKQEFNFKLEVESLNKEIKFICGQNEQQNSKLLQDFLSLQEKYAKVSFEVEKLNENSMEQARVLNEKNELAAKKENEKSELTKTLEQEKWEKNQLREKIRNLESLNEKVHFGYI
jgi:hypothetical protein